MNAELEREIEFVVDAFRAVAKALLKNPGIARTEAEVYGSDYRVIGYRLTRDPQIIRFDYKQFVKHTVTPNDAGKP